MPRANRFAELKRPQNHEQKPGNNVDHGEKGMTREYFVEVRKLLPSGARHNCGRRETMSKNWAQINNSTGGNSHADQCQKNYCAPQRATQASSRLHTSYYAELATVLSLLFRNIQLAINFSSGCQ